MNCPRCEAELEANDYQYKGDYYCSERCLNDEAEDDYHYMREAEYEAKLDQQYEDRA